MASDTRNPVTNEGKVREKVALKPGFHLADWVRLSQNMSRPTNPSQRITRKELAQHNSQFDSWTVYKGKVYNLTNYFPYHPGGEAILRAASGKDCTDLVIRYHRWVNVESILVKCLVGVLTEDEIEAEGGEEGDGKEIPLDGSLSSVSAGEEEK